MSALTVSAARPVIHQAVLWPWVGNRPIRSPAEARVHVGRFFEDATRVLTGSTPHTTDGRADVCPDLSHDGNEFIEVKALSGGSAYQFQHRLERDQRLCDERFAFMTYVYWLHDAPATTATDTHGLYGMLAAHAQQVLVIPAERLWKAAKRMPTFQLCYRADGSRMPAYRFSRRQLLEMAKGRVTLRRRVGKVLGAEVGAVTIRGPDIARMYPALTDTQRERAADLLAELSAHRLDVALLPAPDSRHPSHQVRVVFDTNPAWYSVLCRQYPAKRAIPRRKAVFDTDIRRRYVLDALERLSRGVCKHEYDWRLRQILG